MSTSATTASTLHGGYNNGVDQQSHINNLGAKLEFVTDEEERVPRPVRQRPAPAMDSNGKPIDALVQVQPLKKSEMQPSYAQDLGSAENTHGWYGSMINGLGAIAGSLGSIPCCICCPNPFKPVQQGSVGLVTRFGQFTRSVDPGLVKVNPFSESLKVVDVRIQLAVVPRQSVMTKDNVSVNVDSVVYFHIVNPYKAAFGITDVRTAIVERAQTTLRHVIGARNLQSILTDREAVASEVEEILETVSEKWGVSIEALLLKDLGLSADLEQSLSSAAQQRRIGESKVIAARAEVDSAKLMREAADILSSPAAIQIRQLEALQNMSRHAGSKVIFVPMSLLQQEVAVGGGAGASTGGQFNTASLLAQA